MPRPADRKLLYLLLLLVSLSPLRGFAMAPVTMAMSECEQMQTMAAGQPAEKAAADAVCAFCQVPGCDDGQCNMALCGVFHTPVSFLVIVDPLSAQGGRTPPMSRLIERLPDHTEPPLIRPPIALHS